MECTFKGGGVFVICSLVMRQRAREGCSECAYGKREGANCYLCAAYRDVRRVVKYNNGSTVLNLTSLKWVGEWLLMV